MSCKPTYNGVRYDSVADLKAKASDVRNGIISFLSSQKQATQESQQPTQETSEVTPLSDEDKLIEDLWQTDDGDWVAALAAEDDPEKFKYNITGKTKEEALQKIKEVTSIPNSMEEVTVDNEVKAEDATEDDTIYPDDVVVESYSPLVVNIGNEKFSESIITIVRKYYNDIKKEKDNPNFEDAIIKYLEHVDVEVAEQFFDALKFGWTSNNYPGNTKIFNAVYDKYFSTISDTINEMTAIFAQATIPETISNGVSNITTPIKSPNPTVKAPQREAKRLNKVDGKSHRAAFLGIENTIVRTEDENGVWVEKEVSIQDTLNTNSEVNLNIALDPNRLNKGESVDVLEHTDSQNVLVTDYDENGIKQKGITFKEWVEKYDIKEGSKEWISKVPIIAKQKDDIVFFIHDNDWFTHDRVIGLNKEEKLANMKIAKEENYQLRKSILENEGTQLEITVKESGGYEVAKTPGTITEMAPNAEITVVTADGVLIPSVKGVVVEPWETGRAYQVREGVNSGEKKLYPATSQKIDSVTAKSISSLMFLYLYNTKYNKGGASKIISNNNNSTIEQLRGLGINVTDSQSVANYLKQHVIMLQSSDTKKSVVMAIKQLERNDKIKDGTVVFGMESGKVYCGVKIKDKIEYVASSPSYVEGKTQDNENDKDLIFVSPGKFLQFLTKNRGNIIQNVDKDSLVQNSPVVQLVEAEVGKIAVKVLETKYEDHIKNNLETDIKSYDINVDGKTKEITIVQPIIEFKIKENTNKNDVENKRPIKKPGQPSPTFSEVNKISDKELEVEYGDTYIDFVSLRKEGEIIEVDC